MDFDRLEQAWRSEANTPDERARTYLMEQLMHALKARRRGEILLFAIPVAAMTFFTAVAASAILAGKVDLGREWGAMAMLGICWAVLLAVFIAGLLSKRPRGAGSPVRQTLESLLAANRRARVNSRIFWMSLPVFIVPTLIGVFQLNAAGKATDRDVGQMLLVFGVALAASLGWNVLRFFRVLKPEQRRLEGLLKAYEA
uniref:Transmembrane protein n=1 Tax=Caulobacter sp. (strain K31) TaxID=366602 RepID=B0SVH7_CAUSK